jgi:PAS domain-containing protein
MSLIASPDLAFVVDNLEEGILFLDKDRHIATINKAALKMIGQKESFNVKEDIIDQLCPDLFPGASCAKDCQESGICSLMNQDIEKEKVAEITFSGLNGKMVTLRMRALALSSSEHLARIAILLTDCSHERELEEEVKGVKARIRNVLESAGLISSDTTAL